MSFSFKKNKNKMCLKKVTDNEIFVKIMCYKIESNDSI